MDFSKNDFSQAEVGEPVWSIRHGWGKVKEIFEKTLRVRFNGTEWGYKFDGRLDLPDEIYPTLFWNEIHFDIPERPKRMAKKEIKVWAIVSKKGKIYMLYNSEPAVNNPDYKLLEFSKEIEIEE